MLVHHVVGAASSLDSRHHHPKGPTRQATNFVSWWFLTFVEHGQHISVFFFGVMVSHGGDCFSLLKNVVIYFILYEF